MAWRPYFPGQFTFSFYIKRKAAPKGNPTVLAILAVQCSYLSHRIHAALFFSQSFDPNAIGILSMLLAETYWN
jgi:hypothetical protein